MLVPTVQIIRRAIRTMDVLARYGGDEFVILLPELGRGSSPTACDALPVAKRICEAVAQHPFAVGDRPPLRVTVSVGIGIRDAYDPPSVDPSALFQQADEQLYRAKRAGKNQYAFPDQSPAGVHYHSIPR